MKISIKKLLRDVIVLLDKYPEPYTYAVILDGLSTVREFTFNTVPEIRVVHIADPASEIIADLEHGRSVEEIRGNFIEFFNGIWEQVNKASRKLSKKEAKKFLEKSVELFWSTIAEEDKKAQSQSEGRLYGVFWIPFLIGATALGGIFAYSAGKSTKEYIEEKEEKTSPFVYAGIGAVAVLGLMALTRK